MGATEIAIIIVVIGLRLLLPLTIPYFPLVGVVACLVLDAVDQTIFQQFPAIPLDGYQSYDKALDIYYLTITYLSTFRNWTNQPAFRINQFLFYYRLVGVAAFELTQARALLLVFPNTFEYFFIFYELVRMRWDPARMSRRLVIVAAALIWVFIKLPQEWWIHIAQLDMTDFIKEELFGVDLDSSWAAAVAAAPLVLVAAVAVFAALAVALWWVVTRKAPPADHAPRIKADPLPPELLGAEPYRRARVGSRIFDRALAEKAVLAALVCIIFANMLPGLDARARPRRPLSRCLRGRQRRRQPVAGAPRPQLDDGGYRARRDGRRQLRARRRPGGGSTFPRAARRPHRLRDDALLRLAAHGDHRALRSVPYRVRGAAPDDRRRAAAQSARRGDRPLSFLDHFLQYALHLDVYLAELVAQLGAWVYIALFATIFAETGLVVTPFLPGESLLLTSGTLAGGGLLTIGVLAPLLFLAAFLGDVCNYLIGRFLGRHLLSKPRRYLKPKHVAAAQRFYERHGGLAIILARFLPVVRTLAPFVAGAAGMPLRRLLFFAAVASALWVTVFLGGGYWFGTVPWVQDRLALVLGGLAIASMVPGVVAFLVRRLRAAARRV